MELITDNEIWYGIYSDDMTLDPDEEEEPEYEDRVQNRAAAPRSIKCKY